MDMKTTTQTKAAETTTEYKVWAASYSNEAFDRTSSLASELADIERAAGRPCVPAGYSKETWAAAKTIVDNANAYGAYQQAINAKRFAKR